MFYWSKAITQQVKKHRKFMQDDAFGNGLIAELMPDVGRWSTALWQTHLHKEANDVSDRFQQNEERSAQLHRKTFLWNWHHTSTTRFAPDTAPVLLKLHTFHPTLHAQGRNLKRPWNPKPKDKSAELYALASLGHISCFLPTSHRHAIPLH